MKFTSIYFTTSAKIFGITNSQYVKNVGYTQLWFTSSVQYHHISFTFRANGIRPETAQCNASSYPTKPSERANSKAYRYDTGAPLQVFSMPYRSGGAPYAAPCTKPVLNIHSSSSKSILHIRFTNPLTKSLTFNSLTTNANTTSRATAMNSAAASPV